MAQLLSIAYYLPANCLIGFRFRCLAFAWPPADVKKDQEQVILPDGVEGKYMIAERRFKIARVSSCCGCGDAFLTHSKHDPSLQAVVIKDSGANVIQQLVEVNPDVIVLDVNIRSGGFDVAAQLRSRLNGRKLVFVAKHLTDLGIKQALVLGAKGYLLKSETSAQLVRHAKNVATGGEAFSEQVLERIVRDRQSGDYCLSNASPLESLTELQLEILRHLARGDSLKMVAGKLNLTRKSVDGHKYRIMKKIGVRDRVLLSRFAIREALIEA